MSLLGIVRLGVLSLLVYVGVSKADIGLIKVGQQQTDMAIQYHQETPWWPLTGPNVKPRPVMSHQDQL